MVAPLSAIRLRHGTTTATVLPDEGGVLVDLSVHGVRPLASTPWSVAAPFASPAPDEDTWVRRWHGGWQLCFPSAGQPSEHDHSRAFHGAASQAPWDVVSHRASSATLSWSDGMVCAERTWSLTSTGVVVETAAWAIGTSRDVALAEHLVFGVGLFGALGSVDALIEIDGGGQLSLLDIDGAPTHAVVAWPGPEIDAWHRLDDSTPARLAALVDLPQRSVRVVGVHATASVTWTGDALPHALLWEEIGATSQTPWSNRVGAMGVEPTSAPHGLGTGRNDGVVTLSPERRTTWAVRLDITPRGMR